MNAQEKNQTVRQHKPLNGLPVPEAFQWKASGRQAERRKRCCGNCAACPHRHRNRG